MKIEDFKNITIAYMRNIGEYGAKNEMLMEEFKEYLESKHLFHDKTIILGIALDHPDTTPTDELRYDVGLIINEDMKLGLEKRSIDDGRYAIYEVAHTQQGVMEFWQNISHLTAELPIDYDKPIMERYTMDKVANHLCEFCIPLRR